MGEQVAAGLQQKQAEQALYTLVLPVIQDQKSSGFEWLIKFSQECTLKTEYWKKILKISEV